MISLAIVSGGTGGHIYPGLAVAEELKRRDPRAEVLFLGSAEGMEKDIVPRAGFPLKLVRARAFLRKISYKAISAPFVSLIGFFQAIRILRAFRPRALFSTGGYAGLPAALAAKFCSIPVYLHEQNVLPGFSNRFCRRWAKKVFLSFEETRRFMEGMVVGNPVRREIIAADREAARRRLGYAAGDKVVLIMGGSQGARKINETVTFALPLLAESRDRRAESRRIKILHVVGRRDAKQPAEKGYDFYRREDYLYNVQDALAAADLAVSRAGATAIAEFLVRGIPMILIPFPFSADGHQELNARVLEKAGAAVMINNDALTPEKFVSLLDAENMDLLQMKKSCAKLARPRAAEEIVRVIFS